jgi:CRP/FNR family transcriptional regulator, anaerobic regulatory protein
MLKIDGARPATTRRQCDHCPVRRGGLCNSFADGSGLDLADLEDAHYPVRVLDANDTIYSQGESSDTLFNVVSGWVELHQDMPDGRRHISQFLLPGALFGIKPMHSRFSHGATTITPASICAIPTSRVSDLRRLYPSFNERFIWLLERENDITNQALMMTAEGNSLERVARILWGLAARLSKAGAIQAGLALKVPLTQRHIADATGLTAVHVNRVIRRLREQGLVEFHDGIMVIGDPQGLAALASADAKSDTRWETGTADTESFPSGGWRLSLKAPPIVPDWLIVSRKRRAADSSRPS